MKKGQRCYLATQKVLCIFKKCIKGPMQPPLVGPLVGPLTNQYKINWPAYYFS